MNANDYLKLYQDLTAKGYTSTMEELMEQILADQDPRAVDQQIGMVTAYAYAVSKGFVGTEDEFAELMANLGTTAQEIKAAVENFVNNTVPAAVQQVTATGETQVRNVNTAGETQLQSVNTAGAAQRQQITTEGTQQRQSVTEAGAQQLQAINTAGEAVMAAAERSASAAARSATEAGSAKTDAEAAKTEAQRAASAAADSSAAAATSAALATSVVNLTDKDDENKLYSMAWSVENGFPVLTLTERT